MTEITMGLRFDRREAVRLRDYAEDLRRIGADSEAIELFDKAADDCRDQEPMQVVCNDPEEVKVMAHGFVRLGFLLPEIVHLGRDVET